MNHEELRKMQNIQYEMLRAVDEVCERHHIQYYLMFGTLLGAVRHQGSIPWDNDIDIAMTRQELKKFLSVANELKEPLFLKDICYASIDYAGLTRVIWPNVEGYGNVHIDIFIFDYARKRNEKIQKIIGAYCSLLHMAKLSESEKSILETHFAENNLKKMVVKFSRVVEKVLGGSSAIEKKIYRLVVCEHPTDQYWSYVKI